MAEGGPTESSRRRSPTTMTPPALLWKRIRGKGRAASDGDHFPPVNTRLPARAQRLRGPEQRPGSASARLDC
eukprot:5366058-Alexandrium_andersonii.AAC.1